MLSVEEYRDRVRSLVTSLQPAEVELVDALGLVLAETIVMPRPMPAFDNSSMDGYAVHCADFTGAESVQLEVIDDLPAGASTRPEVPRGCTARIMTGAPMPLGADAVVPVERTDGGLDVVTIRGPVNVGDCIRRSGEDLEQGEVAVAAGSVLTSRNLGLIASCDRRSVRVIPRPRIAVISTGSELVRPGEAVGFGQLVDSNSTLLAAAVRECGAAVQLFGPVVDDDEAFSKVLLQAAESADLIITSGGVSMGAYDTVKEVLSARGGVDFVKVAMQPGMPQGCGRVDGTPIITLPGNPVSTFVSYQVFVRPVIRVLAGLPDEPAPTRTATLTVAMHSPETKVQFARGVVTGSDTLLVAPVGGQGSHIMGGLALSNCLIVLPVGLSTVEPGTEVEILDLR